MRIISGPKRLGAITASLAVSASLAVVGGVSSAATKPHGSDLSGVTLRTNIAPATAQLLQDSGAFNNVPYKITYASFPSGNAGFAALAAGQLDLVTSGEETPIYASAAGQPIKVFSVSGPLPLTAPPRSASVVAILVPQSSPIKTIKDLLGKKIGVVPQNFSTYTVVSALRSIGKSLSDITPVQIANSSAGGALFASGAVDAISLNVTGWAPLIVNSHARVLLYSNKYIDNLNFISADASSLANPTEGAALRDFAARYGKYEIWANHHQSTVAQWNSQQNNVSLAITSIQAAYGHATPLPLDQWAKAAREQNTEANILHNIGQLNPSVNFTTLLSPPKASQWPFTAEH